MTVEVPEGRRGASAAADEGFVTADMVAQWAYCPRRLHLMYCEARWADNEFTAEGTWVHRRTDRPAAPLPEPGDPDAPRVVRSLLLESERLRLRARLDLAEWDAESGRATPVEVKRAVVPPGGDPYPPERLQIGVQALLLRENGHPCDEGIVYYAGSRTRVRIPIEADLIGETIRAIEAVRDVLGRADPPPPLEDSPKCPGCSLVGICLPDETQLLAERGPRPRADAPLRRLVPARDDAMPLYVQEQGAHVGKRGQTLVVTKGRETLGTFRLIDVSQLVLCGHVRVSPDALHLLCETGIPVVHLSRGHWFYGVTAGAFLRNAFDRAAQYARAADPAFALEWARRIVLAKVHNQRTLLRRNGPSGAPVLDAMKRDIGRIRSARSLDALRGIEGEAAALYFQSFQTMLRVADAERDRGQRGDDGAAPPDLPAGDAPLGAAAFAEAEALPNLARDDPPSASGHPAASAVRRPARGPHWPRFEFSARNRRPPRDPVNALLSFGYALLTKDATVALLAAGLDPYWGLYHVPRHGRPALALDLMEEFRPLIVDSAVVTAINTGLVVPGHFESTGRGCSLTPAGRKAFLRAYENRMGQLVTHPVFQYRVSWRRVLSLQAMLLARTFRGAICTYPAITTR